MCGVEANVVSGPAEMRISDMLATLFVIPSA